MSNPMELSDAEPDRIGSLNFDSLSEEQILQIPRTRQHLTQLRVNELRAIARDSCGPGTWISHASKDELVEGAMKGKPPVSAQATERAGDRPSPEARETKESFSHQYAEPVAESLVQTLTSVAEQIVSEKIGEIESRLQEIEKELGIETGEGEIDHREEVTEILEEKARSSERAAKEISNSTRQQS